MAGLPARFASSFLFFPLARSQKKDDERIIFHRYERKLAWNRFHVKSCQIVGIDHRRKGLLILSMILLCQDARVRNKAEACPIQSRFLVWRGFTWKAWICRTLGARHQSLAGRKGESCYWCFWAVGRRQVNCETNG